MPPNAISSSLRKQLTTELFDKCPEIQIFKTKNKTQREQSRCKKRYQGSIPLEYYITVRRLWGWCHSCWTIFPCSGREGIAGRMSGLRDHRQIPADHLNALCFISASISAQHAIYGAMVQTGRSCGLKSQEIKLSLAKYLPGLMF